MAQSPYQKKHTSLIIFVFVPFTLKPQYIIIINNIIINITNNYSIGILERWFLCSFASPFYLAVSKGKQVA